MIFALLTLLAALGLAAVAGWFSIIGIMSIYAGAAFHALIMGIALEAGKLVTTSWLYRNWDYAGWKLKIPLVIFTLTLMLATSIGVFGFLSKAHLEQGAGTIDNSAKIERLDQQIAREKATIDDDQKVTQQLDATINSYLGKDRTDRSLSVRRSQAPQRKQLRDDIDAAQKRIDGYSDEKLKLNSQLRQQQLDVGPIRYIAELWYGADGNAEKNIESAVRIFTLIIVSSLDPLAVILLIAANQTLLRREREKKEQKEQAVTSGQTNVDKDLFSIVDKESSKEDEENITLPQEDIPELRGIIPEALSEPTEETVHVEVLPLSVEVLNEEKKVTEESNSIDQAEPPVSSESSLPTAILSGTIEDREDRLYEHSYEESTTSTISDQLGSEIQEINEEVEDTVQGIDQRGISPSEDSGLAISENVYPKAPIEKTVSDGFVLQPIQTATLPEIINEEAPTFDDLHEANAEAEGMLFRTYDTNYSIETNPVDNLGSETSETTPDMETDSSIHEEMEVGLDEEEITALEGFRSLLDVQAPLPVIRSPSPSRIEKAQTESIGSTTPAIEVEPWKKGKVDTPWTANHSVLAELIGSRPHFIPIKINEENKTEVMEVSASGEEGAVPTIGIHEAPAVADETLQQETENEASNDTEIQSEDTIHVSDVTVGQNDKYPKALSWLNEFKRT